MSTAGWTFLTNHTHVLVCIARDPGVAMRSISAQVGITERAVLRIITDLVAAGYLVREREGRGNTYRLHTARPLRHPLEQGTLLEDLLAVLLPGPATVDRPGAVPPASAARGRGGPG